MTTADILSRIQGLLPDIRARRQEIEDARQLPSDLADRLRRSGIFALSVPRAIGGTEVSLPDLMRVSETLAAADGSTGWCAMVGMGNNVVAGYLNETGAREVFADPTAPTAGLAAPAGAAVRSNGGFKISGRWPFASGITHSDWVWAGCLVMENGQPRMTPMGPEIVHVCMPVHEVQIHDTWHVSGLRGTGSHDFTVKDLFVPVERTFALLDPAGHRSEPLYRMPPLGQFVYQVAAVSLGIARGTLDELAEMAESKVPTLYQQVLADKAVAQVELARAEARLRSARAFLYDTVDEMWQTVLSGGALIPRQIAMGRMASTHAAEVSAAVTRTAATLGGGSALYTASALQRHARDAEAVTHHFTVAPHSWEEAGRVLLGRPPIAPVF